MHRRNPNGKKAPRSRNADPGIFVLLSPENSAMDNPKEYSESSRIGPTGPSRQRTVLQSEEGTNRPYEGSRRLVRMEWEYEK
jgi:hypothetical protein